MGQFAWLGVDLRWWCIGSGVWLICAGWWLQGSVVWSSPCFRGGDGGGSFGVLSGTHGLLGLSEVSCFYAGSYLCDSKVVLDTPWCL